MRHDVSKNEVLSNLNLSVENKHNEVSAKLANYVQLEKEAKNPDLSRNVQVCVIFNMFQIIVKLSSCKSKSKYDLFHS